jgi:hypothetical protein
MRITINLNEELVFESRRVTGIEDHEALIHEGLRVLIQRGNARKLALLGGTQPNLNDIQRRR